jgi:hypothetical protein
MKIWRNRIIFNLTCNENLLEINKYKINIPQIYVDRYNIKVTYYFTYELYQIIDRHASSKY